MNGFDRRGDCVLEPLPIRTSVHHESRQRLFCIQEANARSCLTSRSFEGRTMRGSSYDDAWLAISQAFDKILRNVTGKNLFIGVQLDKVVVRLVAIRQIG